MTTTVYIANEADPLKGRKLHVRQVDKKGEDWNPATLVNPGDAIVLHVHAGCSLLIAEADAG